MRPSPPLAASRGDAAKGLYLGSRREKWPYDVVDERIKAALPAFQGLLESYGNCA